MIKKILNKLINKDEKDKTILKNIFISFVIRGMALVLALVKMPLYIDFFDNEEILGIWFTLLSILTWIFNFDLGIGNGLRNKLVKPIEEKDDKEIKHYVSSAYISIFCVIILFGLIFSFVIPNVNWNLFFNTTVNIDNSIFIKSMFIILFGLLLQFLLKLVNSIYYSLQKAYVPSLLSFISELTLLILIVIIDKITIVSQKLPLMAMLYTICMSLPLFIANIKLFCGILKKSKPSIRYYSSKYAKSILSIGGMFFWIQLMYMVIVNTNEYLITWFVGPKHVVDYQIYYKLFNLIGTLFTLMLTPIWSMVTKAINNKDFNWVRKLYVKLKKLTLIAIGFEFLIIPLLQFVINIWLNDNAIVVNHTYALLFAISGSLIIWNGVISTIVNGIGRLKIQFIFMTLGVILNIPLAYFLCNTLNSWIGVVIANIISLLPYCIIQPIYLKKYLK